MNLKSQTFCKHLVTLKMRRSLRALKMENPNASPTVKRTMTSTMLPTMTTKSNMLKDDLKKVAGPSATILRANSKMKRHRNV